MASRRLLLTLSVPCICLALDLMNSSALAQSDENTTKSEPPSELTLSLESAVRLALENSFPLEIARLNRAVQDDQVDIEEAAFDLRLSATGGYYKYRQPTVSALDIGGAALGGEVITNPYKSYDYTLGVGGRARLGTQYSITLGQSSLDQPLATGSVFGFNPQDTSRISLELTQPLLRGAGSHYNTSRLRIAQNNRQIADNDLERAATDFVFEVEVAYWQLSFARKNYEAKVQAYRTAEENQENTVEGQQVGVRSESDVALARSQRALRNVEVSEAEILLHDSHGRLVLLLNQKGMAAHRAERPTAIPESLGSGRVIPSTEPTGTRLPTSTEMALEIALETRPDYRRLDLERRNREVQLDVTGNEILPQLDLRARWDQLGLDKGTSDSISAVGNGKHYNWYIGFELGWSLGGRAERKRQLQAKSQLDEARFRAAQLRNQIALEVDQSVKNLNALGQRIEVLEERVQLQRDLLQKENEKLSLGRTVYYNVSVIENDLIDSEAQALRARVEYEVAKANHHRIQGTLLKERGILRSF